MTFGVSSADKRGQMWLFSSDDMVKWTYEQVLFGRIGIRTVVLS